MSMEPHLYMWRIANRLEEAGLLMPGDIKVLPDNTVWLWKDAQWILLEPVAQ